MNRRRMEKFCVGCGISESETPAFIDKVLIPCGEAMKTVWHGLVDKYLSENREIVARSIEANQSRMDDVIGLADAIRSGNYSE